MSDTSQMIPRVSDLSLITCDESLDRVSSHYDHHEATGVGRSPREFIAGTWTSTVPLMGASAGRSPPLNAYCISAARAV